MFAELSYRAHTPPQSITKLTADVTETANLTSDQLFRYISTLVLLQHKK